MAAVGAVALAGRRGGLDEDDVPVAPRHGLVERPRPTGTGTMAEGVAGYGVTVPLPEPAAEDARARAEPAGSARMPEGGT